MANSITYEGLGSHLTLPPSKKKRKKRKCIQYKNNTLINDKVAHLTNSAKNWKLLGIPTGTNFG